jgi:hypothetical protein
LGVSPPVDGGELGRRIEEIWHKVGFFVFLVLGGLFADGCSGLVVILILRLRLVRLTVMSLMLVLVLAMSLLLVLAMSLLLVLSLLLDLTLSPLLFPVQLRSLLMGLAMALLLVLQRRTQRALL